MAATAIAVIGAVAAAGTLVEATLLDARTPWPLALTVNYWLVAASLLGTTALGIVAARQKDDVIAVGAAVVLASIGAQQWFLLFTPIQQVPSNLQGLVLTVPVALIVAGLLVVAAGIAMRGLGVPGSAEIKPR